MRRNLGRLLRTAIPLFAATIFSAAVSASDHLPIRPDTHLTPGAVLTTDVVKLCQPGYAKSVRHTSGKLKSEIYRVYGIDKTVSHFEVDHLISLELGGADVAANLWPQSYDTTPWNARLKDKLEDRLHALVCAGTLRIEEAQHEIATDWVAAYIKYVGAQ
jgi:hypothetical protein